MTGDRRTAIERHVPEAELDDRIVETEDDRLLRRLVFVKSLYMGDTLAAAAARVGRSDATGSRWAARWNRGGIEGLAPDFGGGRPPKLDAAERARLREILAADGPWTARAIRSVLEAEFDVSYHPAYLGRFLRSIGARYVEPGTDPGGDDSGGWRVDADEGADGGADGGADEETTVDAGGSDDGGSDGGGTDDGGPDGGGTDAGTLDSQS